MRSSFKQFARLMTRRSRSGQSIILVAFAFIALIAFVGIATDVALLFVRFSTLRRAVDAAAIAAAGQVRESASYLSLNAVAQQFIKVHGIDPSSVVVETCETEIVNYLKTAALGTTSQQALDARVAANSELCKKNPQKLVRVTAQVQSQTAFLQLIGWKTVTLEANALSQTAVLDVALVLDTSLSEAADTKDREKATWDAAVGANPPPGGNTIGEMIYPCPSDANCTTSADNSVALKNFMDFTNYSPYVDPTGAGTAITNPPKPWGLALDPVGATGNTTKAGFRTGAAVPVRSKANGALGSGQTECWSMPQPNNMNDQRGTRANYSWAACCNDPSTQTDDAAGATTFASTGVFNSSANWYLYDPDTNNVSDPAESVIMTSGYNPFAPDPSASGTVKFAKAAKVVSGDKDGNMSDLVCRPFKDVRDAARKFIKKLDFVRGDRVFLVTFDSSARAIVPLGSTIPAITDKTAAIRALNMQVGVEVNPYPFQIGCQSLPGQIVDAGNPNGWQIADYGDVSYKNVLSYWSISQCPDTNTGGGILAGTSVIVNPDWIRRDSVWVMVVLSDGYPNRTPAAGNGGIGLTERNWLQTNVTGDTTSMPNYASPDADQVAKYCWKYTTVPANTATGDYQDGTGGVNGTTPVANPNYGLRPQWCSTILTNSQPNNAGSKEWGLGGGFRSEGINDKGSFGFCPWWTFCDLAPEFFAAGGVHPGYTLFSRTAATPQCVENNPRGIWDTAAHTTWPATLNEQNGTIPTCSDNDPDSRHFCQDGFGRINPSNPLDPFQAVGPNNQPDPTDYYCDPHYDPEDYARDRVDFAALINYMDRGADNKAKKGNFIAMYSIYFQHNNQTGLINENILGVKFLRYAADAGDNGLIDNHLQRWYRDLRDGVGGLFNAGTPKRGWQLPPMGLNEGVDGSIQTALQVQFPPNNVGSAPNGTPNFTFGVSAKTLSTFGTQPVPPTYDGKNAVWTGAPYNYAQLEDPCAAYDFRETGNLPTGAGSAYENIARTDCGQFFYADTSAKINKAFTEIAGRLFTRLSR